MTEPERQTQDRTPYLDALVEHLQQNVLSFHVPGHQGGRGAGPRLESLLGTTALAADLTEVLGIDDLHRPLSQCGEAQQLAAAAFGAEETHFLVNGSTSGNHAMLLAATGPGELVLVPRNAHRSVWGGLLLSGGTAAVYEPPFDERLGVYGVPTVACLHKAVGQHPGAKVFFLSSPSYYGHACDSEGLVEAAHQLGLLVLVDEAWGAHLGFHPDFPTSAVHAGADLVVQSTHKLLPSLTQTAMLHVCGKRVDRVRLNLALRTLLSSSPNALLVASLDSARHQFAMHGQEILQNIASLAALADKTLNGAEGIFCRSGKLQDEDAVSSWDPTRLVISALERGYTGHELESYLRYEHRLQIEMSDLFGVVVVLTAGHATEHVTQLMHALQQLPRQPLKRNIENLLSSPPPFPHTPFTPRDALAQKTEHVPWKEAAGRRSAETVTLYPPGIPWLLPGEVIHKEVLHQLKQRQQAGGQIQGASDPHFETLAVLIESSLERKTDTL